MNGGLQDKISRSYWPNGKLKHEWTYVRGVLHGPYRDFREDGTESMLGEYVDGRQTGLWMIYAPDGSVNTDYSGIYEDGVRVKPWEAR